MRTSKLPSLQTLISRLLVTHQMAFFLIITFVMVGASYLNGLDQVKRQKQATTFLSQKAGGFVDDASRILNVLAGNSPIQDDLVTTLEFYRNFDALYKLNRDGRMVAASPIDRQIYLGMDMSAQSYFNPHLKTKSISPVFISPHTGNPTVTITVPIQDSGGILVGELSLQNLQESINRANISQSDILYITDQRGYLLVYPDYERVRRQENIRQLGIIERAQQGQITQLYYVDNELVIGSIFFISQTGWWAVTQEPVIDMFMLFIDSVILEISLALLVFVLFNWRERVRIAKQVVAPLNDLNYQTQQLAAGDYFSGSRLHFDEAPYIEISSLANSFERMEQAIRLRETALRESENRYRELFENSPIAIMEENFSVLKSHIDNLRESGVTDWRTFFNNHPAEVRQCTEMIIINRVNKAALEMFESPGHPEKLTGVPLKYDKGSSDVFGEEMICLAEGKHVFDAENVYQTLAGKNCGGPNKLDTF